MHLFECACVYERASERERESIGVGSRGLRGTHPLKNFHKGRCPHIMCTLNSPYNFKDGGTAVSSERPVSLFELL